MSVLFIMALVASALAAGLAVLAIRKAFVEVPSEDRQFLDPPPGMFRVIWPLIQLVSFRLAPLLSVSYRQKTQLLLRYAGLDYALSPEQFFASKILAGGLCAGVLQILLAPNGGASLLWLVVIFVCGYVYSDLWLRDQREARQRRILQALPCFLAFVIWCVEDACDVSPC